MCVVEKVGFKPMTLGYRALRSANCARETHNRAYVFDCFVAIVKNYEPVITRASRVRELPAPFSHTKDPKKFRFGIMRWDDCCSHASAVNLLYRSLRSSNCDRKFLRSSHRQPG
jgi:hypothetical protein